MTNIFYVHSIKEKRNIRNYGPDIGDALIIEHFEKFIIEQGPDNFLPIQEALDKKPSNNKIALTFDDGFKDFMVNAIPIIEKYNIPVTLFVTTSTLDGQRRLEYWIEEIIENTTSEKFQDIDKKTYQLQSATNKNNLYKKILHNLNRLKRDERTVYLDQLMKINQISIPQKTAKFLDWDDLFVLKKNPLITIGSHCIHHDRLSPVNIKTATNEMKASKIKLEQNLKTPIRYISYPYGSINFLSNILINNMGYDYGFATGIRKKYLLYPFKRWLIPRTDLKSWLSSQKL